MDSGYAVYDYAQLRMSHDKTCRQDVMEVAIALVDVHSRRLVPIFHVSNLERARSSRDVVDRDVCPR